jgi:iron-sulfur cluster assembly accessory protein
MILLTENAAQHLRHLLELKNAPSSSGLRVRVEKGGCAGWQYTMSVDEAQPLDQVFHQHGVHLIVDPESLSFLNNSQIDYIESLNDSGFRVENPNAVRNCGCGTSFEPKTS